jgi:hypothetical protein
MDTTDTMGTTDTTDTTPGPLIPQQVVFDKEIAESLLLRLAHDMWAPYVTLEPFEIPYYVEDNPATRLAMRWPDYHLAEIARHPGRRLVSIDSIDVSVGDWIDVGTDGDDMPTLLSFGGMAEIRYTRVNPSVSGVNVAFSLVVDISGDSMKIVAIDMVFDSNYRSMREEAERQAGDGALTIGMIDAIVDAAISGIR